MEVLGLMLGERLHSSSVPASPDGKRRAQLCLSDPSRGLARQKGQACDFVRGKRARLGRHDHISDLPLAIGSRCKSQMRRRRGTWTLTGRLIGTSTGHGQDCMNHSHLPISRFLCCLDNGRGRMGFVVLDILVVRLPRTVSSGHVQTTDDRPGRQCGESSSSFFDKFV